MEKNRALTAEKNQLIMSNYDLVVKMTKKYKKLLPEEDILSAAEEAICAAALNYDETEEASFRTYAKKYMKGFIYNHYRDVTPRIEDEDREPIYVTVVSIDSLVNDDDELNDEELTGEDMIPAESQVDVEHEERVKDRVEQLLMGLTEEEVMLVKSKYDFDGAKSIAEIAKEWGISERAVYKKIEKIEFKLARKAVGH